MGERARGWKLLLWIVGCWWLAHTVVVAGHVLYVLLYSLFVAPGLEHAAYVAHAEQSGPWFSIVFGGPVFYAVGRILRRQVAPHGRRAALAVLGLYSVTDLVISLAFGALTPLFAAQWMASQGVKLAAVWWATRGAQAGG